MKLVETLHTEIDNVEFDKYHSFAIKALNDNIIAEVRRYYKTSDYVMVKHELGRITVYINRIDAVILCFE